MVDVIVDAATGGARNFLGLKLAGLPETSGETISFGFGFVVFGLSEALPFFWPALMRCCSFAFLGEGMPAGGTFPCGGAGALRSGAIVANACDGPNMGSESLGAAIAVSTCAGRRAQAVQSASQPAATRGRAGPC